MNKRSSSYIYFFVIAVTATILSGCPVKRKIAPSSVATPGETGSAITSVESKDMETVEVVASEDYLIPEATAGIESEDLDISEEEAGLSAGLETAALKDFNLQDIFFDYDSTVLSRQTRDTLSAISDWMSENGDVRLRIEGHADERGTSEYNLALGERRADAAKNYLVALGIEESRFSTVSYGEEMPIDNGHSEAAWSKNRRVHFEIQGK